MKKLTQFEVEGIRGELFHMVLFSMAWVLIGEYIYRFQDYAIGMGLILAIAVGLAIYSIRLYSLEDGLQPGGPSKDDVQGMAREWKRDQLYALIVVIEGLAAFLTWTFLLREGFATWQVAAFAVIAGLHFFPLAWVTGVKSYWTLGVWITALGVWGYYMYTSKGMDDRYANTIVCYGCALGASLNGIVASVMASQRLK